MFHEIMGTKCKRILRITNVHNAVVFSVMMGGMTAAVSAAWRKVPNTAFAVGEELVFDVGWKSASAGEMSMKVKGTTLRKNRPAYQASIELNTNKVVDAVFEVKNRYESWLDVDALVSVGHSIQSQEGKKKKVQTVFYDPLTGRYKSRVFRPGKDTAPKNEEGEAGRLAQDIVSALYFVRAQPLAVGKSVVFPVMNGTKTQSIQIRVLRKENVEHQGREFPCLVLEPLIDSGEGFASHPKASIYLWVTDDARHWPLKLAAKTFVGDVGATLRTVNGANVK
ncbi:MAG: hypothetical protein KCHDKBKB_01778 [Elusimicrobia bacterium]|nr:hypothetical protein [Elusimicrobiota bacterium]